MDRGELIKGGWVIPPHVRGEQLRTEEPKKKKRRSEKQRVNNYVTI